MCGKWFTQRHEGAKSTEMDRRQAFSRRLSIRKRAFFRRAKGDYDSDLLLHDSKEKNSGNEGNEAGTLSYQKKGRLGSDG